MTRREWLRVSSGAAVTFLVGGIAGRAERAAPGALELTVWKTPTCGCCSKWVEHMRAAGFTPKVTDLTDVTPIKRKHGVPVELESCHTAIVGGYTIEGHIPADVVQQMLKEKPAIVGIAVPGMPAGSPGMESGTRKASYSVIAFDKAGKTRVFAKR